MGKRVLAFGCHPDDIEFMAAGTLALLSARGWDLHLATMTGGEVGSAELKSREIRAVRLKEAEESAAILGAAYHYAGGCDLQVRYDDHYQQLAVRVVREVAPDVILTHFPTDYLLDHEETSRLVRNAAFIASVPLYDDGLSLPAIKSIPYLYYWNAFGGTDNFGRPIPVSFGIEITSVMETKRRMLEAHASQRDWLKYINNFDKYAEEMLTMSRKQGELIGREYAECFVQHVGSGHPVGNILARELEDHFVRCRPG